MNIELYRKKINEFIVNESVHFLKCEWKDFLVKVKDFGKVKVVTFNNDALHVKTGVYDNVSFHGPVGQALTREIDLRLFLMFWKFTLIEFTDYTTLHFFDNEGNNIHSITFLEQSEEAKKFFINYTLTETPSVETETAKPVIEKPDSEINAIGLKEAWRNLKDTHEFFEMLRKFQVTRTQALRLASEDFVKKIGNERVFNLLENAVSTQVPIMVFIGNKGCIQIHTDPINNLKKEDNKILINDDNFYMELNENSFFESYIVKKPTTDGIVTAVEVFDEKGEMIVQFFGERKPNVPELLSWRELVETI